MNPQLAVGTLVRRYKRFLADVATPDGVVTMHCPNTGAMTGCDAPGSEVWYSVSDNPKRKYACTLEVVIADGQRIGVNTLRANGLFREALETGNLAGFESSQFLRAEAGIPESAGRFDFLLDERGTSRYVEVKNLTLAGDRGLGLFPDAVSVRALKHVRALMRRAACGDGAALVFCVQHTGVERVTTADEVDPAYGAALRQAVKSGVGVFAFACRIERYEILMDAALPVEL